MPGSSEKINYNLRPAKQIERKMLCEAFWRLSPFGAVSSYRYVGFGSYYFSDFSLFHKVLGVTNMVSIEGDEKISKERFRGNRPFNCIDIKFGMSPDILPKLEWEGIRTILWLDYDFELNGSVLSDIDFFCKNASPGSVILVTVDARPNQSEDPLGRLKTELGVDKVDYTLTDEDLDNWGTAKVFRNIIDDEVQASLKTKNLSRSRGSHLKYRQLFNFHYRDSVRMLTVGGIIYDEGQESTLRSCHFEDLTSYRGGKAPLRIEVPKLTFKELRALNALLPTGEGERLREHSIPTKDLRMYEKVYRWFPTFAETEI